MKRLLFLLMLLPPFIVRSQVKYEIVNKELDTKGYVNHLDVYVAKMADIKDVNKALVARFKRSGVMSLQILYYDSKQVAKSYSKKLFDKSVSEDEITTMGKHVTGKFEYLSINNTQSLHVGREADMY